MSSNPLMIGYEGAWRPTALALPGQRSGRCPSMCVQAVGGGLGGQRLRLVTRAHLRWLDRRPSAYTKMPYTNRWHVQTLLFSCYRCRREIIWRGQWSGVSRCGSQSTLHNNLQRVRDDDAVQWDQRAQDSRTT